MRTKRILAFVLCALILAAFIPAAPKTAYADDDLSWTTEECPKAKEWGWDPPLHDIHWETLQQGNCTVETITKVYCSQCGRSSTTRYAPGHDWDEGVVTKEATCTEAGEITYTCHRLITNMWCGQKKTESIPALGHAWDSGTVKKAATCTSDGVKTYTCSRCGGTKNEAIPATGHTWDNGTVTKAATCTEAGVKTFTCVRDGSHTRTESISALGHNYVNGACTRCGAKDPSVTPVPATPVPATPVPATPAPASKQAPFDGMSIPTDFGFLYNGDPISDILRIVTQPQGGTIHDNLVLTVEAAGGEGEYTYEWWYEPAMLMINASAFTDFMNEWAGDSAAAVAQAKEKTTPLAAEFLDAWKKKNGISGTVDHSVTVTEGTASSTETKTLQMELFNPFATKLSSDSNTSGAYEPGTYWVVVYDQAGHHVTSNKVKVTEALYIAAQPENQNLYGVDSVTLTCRAGGGSGSYSYAWIDNHDTPQGTGSSVEIHDIGDFMCIVTDNVTGEQVSSYACQVYSEERDLRPVITQQPQGIELEYREDGQYNWSLTCLAQAFDGNNENLQYQWSGKTDSGWAPIGASETLNRSYDHGTFRCTITDKRNGQYVTSDRVKVILGLTVKEPHYIGANKETGYQSAFFEFTVLGGEPQYTVKVYTLYKGDGSSEPKTVLYKSLTIEKAEELNPLVLDLPRWHHSYFAEDKNGELIVYDEFARYWIEVTDAKGMFVKSSTIMTKLSD